MVYVRRELSIELFRTVKAGIVVVDADTKNILDVNPAASIIIGDSRDDLIGKQCKDYLCAHKCDGCPVMTANLADGMEDVEDKEIIIHRRDGSKIFALLTISSIILYDEKTEKDRRLFINSLIDITKQKEAEAVIDESLAKAGRMLAANITFLKNGA